MSGREAANAKRNQTVGLQGWEQALRTAPCLPRRTCAHAAEFAEYFPHEETLIFAGIEQRSPRPRENEAQKEHYSGKKRAPPSKR